MEALRAAVPGGGRGNPFVGLHLICSVDLYHRRSDLKNSILAVCDPEEAYAGRLMEYLNERQVSPFYVRAFSSRKALENFLGQEEIEVLLISADMAAEDM